jgi:hypothetical protein
MRALSMRVRARLHARMDSSVMTRVISAAHALAHLEDGHVQQIEFSGSQ